MNTAAGAQRVAIVGAGWAGLACAVELTAAGVPVTVFEAARQVGGRARGIVHHGHRLDNGQHLLVGAYGEVLRLMRVVGAAPETHFDRLPLVLETPGRFRMQLPALPKPFNLACGLFAARGASIREKISAMRFMARLTRNGFRLAEDTTVARWLDNEAQRGALRTHLWDALCLAALTTDPEHASAQIFANVLRDSLGGARDATDLLLPRVDLSALFPTPASRFLAARGGELRLSLRVRGLRKHADGWEILSGAPGAASDHSAAGERFAAVVLAVPPQHLRHLLAGRPEHAGLCAQIAAYDYEPIGTAYLFYDTARRLPRPMLGMPGPLGQWVFDRGQAGGNPGVLACVLSAGGEWDALDDATLSTRLHEELCALLGPQPPPGEHFVIRERRAAFSCRPLLRRPGTLTAEPGLLLAGDHTWADYPATLEGAVRSGVAAARSLLAGDALSCSA